MAEPTFIARSYSGKAIPTDLSVAIASNADTSFTVIVAGSWLESHGANAGSALGTTGPFEVVVDAGLATEEHILCSSVNTSTGVVQVYNSGGFLGRGYDGTTAQAHATSSGTGYVYPYFGSVDGYEANVATQWVNKGTTAGDLVYFSGARAGTRLALGAAGTVLGGGSSAPAWVAARQLVPTAKSGDYTAVDLDFVEMTGTHTVTAPSPAAKTTFGVASVSGVATVTAASGVILGPGLGAGASSIKIGTPGSYVVLLGDGTNLDVVGGGQDTGWVAIIGSLTNSWSSHGAPAYRLNGNRVDLQFSGMYNGASNTVLYTLPAGARPTVQMNFAAIPDAAGNVGKVPVATTANLPFITVNTDGTITGNLNGASQFGVNCNFLID